MMAARETLRLWQLVCVVLAAMGSTSLRADVHYVWTNSPSPAAPHTNWNTAAHVIQDAVDASVAGDTVLVTNGVYASGGRIVDGSMRNRVVLSNATALVSAAGAEYTWIVGQGPIGTNAIRCIWVGSNATVNGFTITGGHTLQSGDNTNERSGGGAWCADGAQLVSCRITGNSALLSAGGCYAGVLSDCIIRDNEANMGGGTSQSDLFMCTVERNTATRGAGCYYSDAVNCVIADNVAVAAYQPEGGGAWGGSLRNCLVAGNRAEGSLPGDSQGRGGGTYQASLHNCTLVANVAGESGGGIKDGSAYNSIIYHNVAPQDVNWSDSYLGYSCTVPLPYGLGNIEDVPRLVDDRHLAPDSPCRAQGSPQYADGVDIDGEPWGEPPPIGCDQFNGSITHGSLEVFVSVGHTNIAPGFAVTLTGRVTGHATSNRWDFGDGTYADNRLAVPHMWQAPGMHTVQFVAYNQDNPSGVSTSIMVTVAAPQVHYVHTNAPSPTAPYMSWETAAHGIQDAIDAVSVPGATVLVTNGVYHTGTREVAGTAHRVVVDRPVRLVSVNGPDVTLIEGAGPVGGDAVRCIYMARNSVLSGFTLTNGYASSYGDGGGAYCQADALLTNCVITACGSDFSGGGVIHGVLRNCELRNNTAKREGGGAAYSTLYDCRLVGNAVTEYWGGAAHGSTLYGCLIESNRAEYAGGGVFESTVVNGVLRGNASNRGGGSYRSTILNSFITANNATTGGGVYEGYHVNCTITGNSATGRGGGAANGDSASQITLRNCILWMNSAGDNANWYEDNPATIDYCCLTPLPVVGVGNIDTDPRLASASHLSSASPCIGHADSAVTSGSDIDGEAWRHPPAIGCDEVHPGQRTGTLEVSIDVEDTVFAAGLTVQLQANISGNVAESIWDFGDATVVSNQPWIAHMWDTPGDYNVVLIALNDTYPGGVSATVTLHVVAQPVLYVSASSSTPNSPYATWATAATNIQDAIDAVTVPGSLVWVTNGLYNVGGKPAHDTTLARVVIDRPVEVRSVNGPLGTVIRADGSPASMRCVYAEGRSRLTGFTLENGHVGDSLLGGGLWCDPGAVVSNCIIRSNTSAYFGGGASAWGAVIADCVIEGNSAANYGGVHGGTLYGCLIVDNVAERSGGGAGGGAVLYDCVITSNRVVSTASCGGGLANGGGVSGCTLYRCVLMDNHAPCFGGGANYSKLVQCVTMHNTAGRGGGADNSDMDSCLIIENTTDYYGGGASVGLLRNCTVAGNTSGSSGGGVYYVEALNCIFWGNSAPDQAEYSTHSTVSYCCLSPLPADQEAQPGCIEADPQFVDPAGGDYDVQPTSPCIDAGQVDLIMYRELDLEGRPRVMGNGVDMGAEEFVYDLTLRALLGGAWRTGQHRMTSGLALPSTSPYAASRRQADGFPTNALDWVLVQLCPSVTSAPAASVSAVILDDGSVVRPDGSPHIQLETKGHQQLVLKHRNHLAVMSPSTVTTNRAFTYDFTTGSNKYWGGAAACVQLDTNLWGCVPGDVDGDGRVTWGDRAMVSNTLGQTGYLQADLNLDGVVTEADLLKSGRVTP